MPWSDLDLLTLHSRWTPQLASGPADNERFRGVRLVAAADLGRWRLLPGSDLPGAVLAQIDAVLAEERPGAEPSPGLIDVVRTAVEDGTAPRLDGGPVYLFGRRRPQSSGISIVTSEDAAILEGARPMSWDDGEWLQLLGGELGPWAAVVADGRVVSLTHTPRPLLRVAAECGVWTDPAFRGRRLAGAATAAWVDLVTAPDRHLFYSTEHCNTASQHVARSFGLRHLGWQWRISAEPWSQGDAWGNALIDHLRGRWTPTPELETDAGTVGVATHPEWCFRPFDEWPWWERELLPMAARGPALVLGAGAGRYSLWLQEQGIDVTVVSSSPGEVRVCRARGVADVRLGDLDNPPDDKRWRAIFLPWGNLGLGGSRAGTHRLLSRLAELAAPDAVLVGIGVDHGGDPDIALRIRYKGVATPWWRNTPIAEAAALVEGSGWALDRHLVEPPYHVILARNR